MGIAIFPVAELTSFCGLNPFSLSVSQRSPFACEIVDILIHKKTHLAQILPGVTVQTSESSIFFLRRGKGEDNET